MRLARPARVTPAAADFVFHIAELLPESSDFFLLGRDFVILFVDLLSGELLIHGLLRIGIVLDTRFFGFALQNVQFLFGVGNFLALRGEALAPGLFGVGIFLLSGVLRESEFGLYRGGRRFRSSGIGRGRRRLHASGRFGSDVVIR